MAPRPQSDSGSATQHLDTSQIVGSCASYEPMEVIAATALLQLTSTSVPTQTSQASRVVERIFKRPREGTDSESSMLESPRPTKRTTLNDRSPHSNSLIQSIESYVTSDQDSTTKERGFKPFWNSQCAEISKSLWLPTETDLHDSGSSSLSGSSIGTAGGLSINIKTRSQEPPKWSSQKILSQSSQSSPAESREGGATETRLVNMKVKIYPTKKQRDWLIKTQHSLRALRNAAIAEVENKKTTLYKLRTHMLTTKDRQNAVAARVPDDPKEAEKHKAKWEAIDSVPSTLRKNTLRKLKDEYSENFKRVRQGTLKKFKMRFSSRKKKSGRINIPLESQAFHDTRPFDDDYIYMFARTKIDDIGTTFKRIKYKMQGSRKNKRKTLPDPRLHDCQILYEEPHRWYILIPYDKPIKSQPAPFKDVSLDPGTRAFQNFYSNDAGVVGTIDLPNRKEMLKKLLTKIKTAQSKRDKGGKGSKWWKLRYRMLWAKVRNKTKDLHAKAVRFLLDNFEEIRIGDMGSEFIKQSRNLNKIVKQEASFLSHYSFRQRLKEHAATRTIVEVAESYTSKTCCKCGNVHSSLGSASVYKCQNDQCNLVIGRDTNGAVNMYIKDLAGCTMHV